MISSEDRPKLPSSLAAHFADLPDPRVERTRQHSLLDILTIAIVAVICGAEGWEDMEEFGESKHEWLATFLSLKNGIPCADTFRRVFAALNPDRFQNCFRNWIDTLAGSMAGKVVAVDGKTLRGSFDSAAKQSPLHMVHAWVADQHLLLGQQATEEKSNEITAIPRLLALLDLAGAVVTIDAMGCQKKIAETIVKQNADYVLALKGNQGTLHQEVVDFFADAVNDPSEATPLSYCETTDGDHGRIEVRRVWSTTDVDWFADKSEWTNLNSLIMVESERTVGDKTSIEQRHYISSVKGHDSAALAKIIRSHWSVENHLHWTLDVAFNEDACRIRKDNGPENFSLLRRIALVLLKRDSKSKRGLAAKRRRAGWDLSFLLSVLTEGDKI